MKKNKLFKLIVLTLCVVLSFTACSNKKSSRDTEDEETEQEDVDKTGEISIELVTEETQVSETRIEDAVVDESDFESDTQMLSYYQFNMPLPVGTEEWIIETLDSGTGVRAESPDYDTTRTRITVNPVPIYENFDSLEDLQYIQGQYVTIIDYEFRDIDGFRAAVMVLQNSGDDTEFIQVVINGAERGYCITFKTDDWNNNMMTQEDVQNCIDAITFH